MWEQIQSNRRRSVLIVTLMGVILVATGAALGTVFARHSGGAVAGAVIALAFWLVLWVTSMAKGDDILLNIAGAREVKGSDHRQLVNVVEEMTIASMLPKAPRVFIVDDPTPNAFATGRKPEKSAVAVTTGLLRILNRDELQGVVAHEIGHIRNRDVALMTTTGIMLGVIVLLADLGMRMLIYGGGRRSRSSSGKDGGGQAIILAVALLFMILAPLFAQLIYYAISRRREYLADASGAMFTRYPEGLASALEKLGGSRKPQGDQSRVTAPMYIVRPLKQGERRNLSSAFSTHPPLAKRIAILRAMGGGAGFASYEGAYQSVTNTSVIGARTLAGADDVAARAPTEDRSGPVERGREASDAMLSAAGFERTTCSSCEAVLKIPPTLAARVKKCPRCGKAL